MIPPCAGLPDSACRLSRAIRRAATVKILVASLVLWLAALFLINGKPFGIAQLRELTGGPTILDMTLTTSPDQVYTVLSALGDAGRAFDLTRIIPLDLVFPFTYALFLAVAISWGLSRWQPESSPWFLLNLAPVIAGAADYCENAGVIAMLLAYPLRLDPVAVFTSVMYIVKFAFSAISFTTLFVALAGWAVFTLHGRRDEAGNP